MCQDEANANALVPETDDWEDGDSAIGSLLASSTTSMGSSILKYRTENGRTYHAYKEGKYGLPNDEAENDRLDHMNHLVSLTLDGKLVICPIFERKEPVRRALDCGTGTGIWAIDFADEHPEIEVIGVDLSPIQPTFVPPNLQFQIDDLEEPWTYAKKFDFIHARQLEGSLQDWPKFFHQCFGFLNPGGYVQIFSGVMPLTSDDNSFPPNSALKRWSELMVKGTTDVGRPLNDALKHEERLKVAGFVNVVKTEYRWPINRWPKDPKAKELGMWFRENIAGGLFGISNVVFTRWLGWTTEELEVFLADVRKEFYDTKIHGYLRVWAVYAQKPLESEA